MNRCAPACLLLLLAVQLTSCDLSKPVPPPKDGGTLTVALAADPPTLNRFVAADAVSVRAAASLFPNLYMARPDLSIAPDLAEAMPSLSDDRKTWTVRLRKGAKWTDGKPIIADDVVTTVKIQQALVARDPGQAIFDWTKLDRVEKVDDLTVNFVLTEVYAPFLANSLATFVAPAHVYGSIDPARMATDPLGQAPPVTGGPYKIEKRDPGKELDLVANPDYYGGRPHIDRIVMKVIADQNSAVNSLAGGDLQWEPDLPADAVGKLRPNSRVTVYSYPDFGYYDVRFNDRQDHLFGDKLVRQAFAYAVDKEAIVKDVTGGTGTPLWGDIPPASWAYDDKAVVRYPVDRDKARGLMQQAGWTIGTDGVASKGGKRFSAKFYVRGDTPTRQKAVQQISQQVKEIGMDLQPTPVDFLPLVDALKSSNFDVAMSGWATQPDPDPFRVFHASQLKPERNADGRDWTGYTNPQLDQLIQDERGTLRATDEETRAERRKTLGQIQKLLGDEVVTYFMWADNTSQGFSSDIGGIETGPRGSLLHLDYDRDVRAYRNWYIKSIK